uniref:Exodeoxyribonuclease V subunit gamma n=1 Tax=Desulfatirhabdium butyrativorans TaxID=340467 RepID=A0A7C4RSZ7_9BACT
MLFLYRSNRIEAFLPVLTDILRDPLPNPLQPEWLCVHSHGTRIWLEQEMSMRLGIWANVYAPFPRELVETFLALSLKDDDLRWLRQEEAALRILAVLEEPELRPEWEALRGYLDANASALSRYRLACRIARLFDEYAVYRSEMVLDWEVGRQTPLEGDPALRWQPHLWRAVYGGHGIRHLASAAARWFKAVENGWSPPVDLPSRMVLFGISFLPPLFCTLLNSFAQWCDIHLFVPSPSDAYWAAVHSRREMILEADRSETAGASFLFDEVQTHPLLISLGKAWRDFQYLIEERMTYHETEDVWFVDPIQTQSSPSLLTILQSDMFHLRQSTIDPERLRDGTITVHACHGPLREVEVLRDCLLALFAEHPEIAPDHVVVMAPDIETYAPWIEAVFGAGGEAGGSIPYTISDVSMHLRSELLEAFVALLRLAEARLTVQEVFDFLNMGCVRAAVGFQADELARLLGWVQQSGVRWGIDGNHRKRVCGSAFDENSWRFGIERMMLGTAMGDGELDVYGNTSPFVGIEGQDCLLLGRFVEVLERLFRLVDRIGKPRTPAEWETLLSEALAAFFAADADQLYYLTRIRRWLMDFVSLSREAGFDRPIEATDVAQMISDQLLMQPSQGGFRRGGITFCSLVPMRNIPFDVVCLIGMNEADFPRKAYRPGFDWIGRKPRIGDRILRDEDRGLFLEALLSVRKRLIMTYTGFDVQSGTEKSPASVVQELMDLFSPSSEPDPDGSTDCPLRLRHPMHAFSPKAFSGGGFLRYGAEAAFSIAQALASEQRVLPPFITKPVEIDAVDEISLDELIRFWRNPTAAFLEHALGVCFERLPGILPDREPIVLDALERWDIGTRRLQSGIQGEDLDRLDRHMLRSGKLPPQAIGKAQYEAIRFRTERLLQTAATEGGHCTEAVFRVTCAGKRIAARLSGICREGTNGLLVCHYGRLGAARSIDFWIRHLVLQMTLPLSERRPSCMIGMDKDKIQRIHLTPMGGEVEDILANLIRFYLDGLRFPLPFFPETSLAFADALENGKGIQTAMANALSAWEGTDYRPGEGQEEAVRLVYRERSPLDRSAACHTTFQKTASIIWQPFLRSVAKQ